MTIYERIRQLRIARGISQDELAKMVGYEGRSAISKVEKGERDISQSMIVKYAKALGVTPTFLLCGKETNTEKKKDEYFNSPEVQRIAQELYDNPQARALFSASKKLSEKDMATVQALIESLTSKK